MDNERTKARGNTGQDMPVRTDKSVLVEPKISNEEAILLLGYVGFCDAIGIGLVCFGLDDFGILDAMTFPVTRIYFRMKGVKGTFDLFTSGLETIPYISALPLKTIGVAAVIYQDRQEMKVKAATQQDFINNQARQVARNGKSAPRIQKRTPARSNTTTPVLTLTEPSVRIPKRLAA